MFEQLVLIICEYSWLYPLNLLYSTNSSSEYASRVNTVPLLNIVGKVFGRLVEVRQGSMMIGEKCFFCDNINDRMAVDGGGAIQIGSKGSCTMKAGEVRNNQNVSRGAGFLVEKGGCLTVKGGSIRNNKVTGVGAVKNFDGERSSFSTFAALCIKRSVLASLKQSRRRKDIPDGLLSPIDEVEITDPNSPEKIFFDKESYKNLTDSIRLELSGLEYSVLQLFLEGNKYIDIAKRLSISEKSVNNALLRIRKKLKNK